MEKFLLLVSLLFLLSCNGGGENHASTSSSGIENDGVLFGGTDFYRTEFYLNASGSMSECESYPFRNSNSNSNNKNDKKDLGERGSRFAVQRTNQGTGAAAQAGGLGSNIPNEFCPSFVQAIRHINDQECLPGRHGDRPVELCSDLLLINSRATNVRGDSPLDILFSEEFYLGFHEGRDVLDLSSFFGNGDLQDRGGNTGHMAFRPEEKFEITTTRFKGLLAQDFPNQSDLLFFHAEMEYPILVCYNEASLEAFVFSSLDDGLNWANTSERAPVFTRNGNAIFTKNFESSESQVKWQFDEISQELSIVFLETQENLQLHKTAEKWEITSGSDILGSDVRCLSPVK